ncbi:MAG: DsbA family protein [Proteobacteria bacterium]|nr:DsbA family protein [Pseudomonadota bacterium]
MVTDNAVKNRVLVVTDPMCSWCWGMSGAVEQAIGQTPEIQWDFLLGGVNTHATHPIGEYGRKHLMRLWHEVHATTGQAFGFRLPDELVYNSTLCCMAVHIVREHTGRPPFGYLHRLQQMFFCEGVNINDVSVLAGAAQEFGVPASVMIVDLGKTRYRELARFEFETAREYGTNALPSLLWEVQGERVLIGGGYMDQQTLVQTIAFRKNLQQPV